MSQPGQVKGLTRPRRASRAQPKLGDENAVSNTTQLPRLVGKSSSSALGGPRLAVKASTVSNATVAGKLAVGTTSASAIASGVAGPRRALGNVSNAVGGASKNVDRTSKDSVTLAVSKTTTLAGASRSRTTSAPASQTTQPQPPSSTGTGLARLRIGGVGIGPSKARRAESQAGPVGVKGQGTSLRGAEWPGAWGAEGQSSLQQQQAGGATIGLGLDAHGVNDYPSVIMSSPSMANSLKRGHEVEVEGDVVVDYDEDDDNDEGVGSKVRIVDDEDAMVDPDDWINNVDEEDEVESEKVLELIRKEFDEQLDYWDTTMVAEYSEEIFEYMAELEEKCMPNPRYMDHQSEIEWPMRTTLIDWLLQVHMRYHMLPETLWIAINIVDRFLSDRVVSLVKFQLVGVTAMFVAAKYEEILAPSVDEFVFMTEGGYTRDEILKGERIILQSLEFNISPYCSPYSWVRRISKADDYDIQTRTLSKFLMEVTLLDHRFLRAKPSMIAAIGMYLARRMLGGDWNESFIYYSNYTEPQLFVPTGYLLENIVAAEFDQKFVYKKYANKKFLKASIFARNWAKQNATVEFNVDVSAAPAA